MGFLLQSRHLEDIAVIVPKAHRDERGFFMEVYRADQFKELGLPTNFVQDNHSLSSERGTLRGLHFQTPPFAQHKLVRVVRGAIVDVAVGDLNNEGVAYSVLPPRTVAIGE